MLQLLSKVKIIDNSGGKKGRVIKILNNKKIGKIGDLVLVSILKNQPSSKIRKGTIHMGIIVRTKVRSNRNPYNIVWSDNAIALVKKQKNNIIPIGSRIKGPISSIIDSEKVLGISKRKL